MARVAGLTFSGNRHIESGLLRGLLGEAVAVGAPYDRERLEEGLLRLGEYYQERGFIQAVIGAPRLTPDRDGGTVVIEIPVSEGERFRIGDVSFEGDPALLELRTREPFCPGAIARAVARVNEAVKGQGRMAVPVLTIRRDQHLVDVTVELRDDR